MAAFRHVVLVASAADAYVPLHSARMQVSPRVLRDSRHGPVVAEMLQRLICESLGPPDGCGQSRLVRVLLDRNYDARAAGVGAAADRFIGRSAHISYLEHVPTVVFLSFLLAEWLV
jgi:hypothetical protein